MGKFARENPKIRQHIELQERKDKLEQVMRSLQSLVNLQNEGQGSSSGRRKDAGLFTKFF
jgi:hypothetical protein